MQWPHNARALEEDTSRATPTASAAATRGSKRRREGTGCRRSMAYRGNVFTIFSATAMLASNMNSSTWPAMRGRGSGEGVGAEVVVVVVGAHGHGVGVQG
jgi:hypothetical protein